MKRVQLIKDLRKLGAEFHRDIGNHEVWIARSGENLYIPRHREIKEGTAKSILKNARKR